jgi:prevent-host-death family protein
MLRRDAAGIRELKAHLSAYLKRVKAGEVLKILERGKEIALLVPLKGPDPLEERLWTLVQRGEAYWGGGKPKGLNPLVVIKGKPLSETILEDRG